MTRISMLLVSLMLAAASGCRMCDSPHDYCGPTYGGQCGEPCLCYERVGSVFTGPALDEYRGGGGMEYAEGDVIMGGEGGEEYLPHEGGEMLEPYVPNDGQQRMAPPANNRRPNDSVRAPSRRRHG